MEYIKSRINFIAISFYFVVAFSFSVLLLGLENMSFTEIDWIFHGKDMTHHYVGWSYFKNDIWRFPPGSNPIYGLENGSSIVYSDAIPLLAFFFKLFKNYLPNNFQYFSFWIFLCFFFQGFISFKLINHYTNNIPYSLIGSFFFLISPILIYRISFHLALGAHWLIILSFYIQTFQSQKFKNILWGILIASSLLIHFYIAASCIIIFGIFFIEEIFTKKNLIYSLKKIFVFLLIIFLTMYFSGYFMMSTIQTLGAGYGNLKLNLLGIFDPYHLQSPVGFDSWSLFLPDLPSKTGEHEGFSYLGFGIILLLFFCGYLFYLNFKYKKKLLFKIYKKKIYIYIFLFFLFLSLSNNIDFGNYELLHLEINKYVYGLLSVLRASGRMFWPSYYLILIFCIIFLFKNFSTKKNILILSLLLLIQIVDTSNGYKQLLFAKKFQPNFLNLTDNFWKEILVEKNTIKTTYVRNATEIYKPLSYYLSNNNVKTNIFWLSRYDREKAAQSRYDLYKKLNNQDIDNTPYIIGKNNHLLNIKEIFKKTNLGFFLRNNFWVIISNKKEAMSENDLREYNKIDFSVIQLDKKIIPKQNQFSEYFGLGWTHNLANPGVWSEGYISTILFKVDPIYNENIFLEMEIEPALIGKNKPKFTIYINDVLEKTYDLNKDYDLNKIRLNLKKNINNVYKIDFKFSNIISPLEVLQSPDARKLGLLVKSLTLKKT